jgi:hypothetical protein
MATFDADQELKTALDAFEVALITPVVSGELAVWGDGVRAQWASLAPLVDRQRSRLHPKQFDEMTRTDPEIFSQVDKLKAEDAALEEEQQKLGLLVNRLTNLAPLIEPDERKFNDLQATLRKVGVAFVAHCKQQQVAVQTWYLEAFNRDRGFVD